VNEAADQARAANAHFLRARVSISDPALMDVVAGFAVLANAVEALAVQLADMKQGFLFISGKVK
jgi:hypothetical protein